MKYELNTGVVLTALIGGAIGWLVSENVAVGAAILGAVLFPAIISLYIPYAQDNPKHVWFKRKIYGWGWTPVTWQGWALTLGYVALVVLFALTLDEGSPTREVAFTFLLPVTLLTIAFIRVAYRTGEKPRWQWGVDKDN
jgi:hypothetical protein